MKGNAESAIAESEHARLASLVAADIELATSLHAPDYELITPGGAALTRDGYLGSIADGSLRYHRFEAVSPVRARVIGEAAIVRYRCAIDVDWPGGHDQGEFWHTDYWERIDGRWQAVWSHATRIVVAAS
jgi:hypothetical protein